MKNHRKPQKPKAITAGKARWLPTQNTRAATFPDITKVKSKKACRGRVVAWD